MNIQNRRCVYCGKDSGSPYTNYCSWKCSVTSAEEDGFVKHLPNDLPIACITADGYLLEHEHGDHPFYKFPIDIVIDGKEETHALIYADDLVLLTKNDNTYFLFNIKKKTCFSFDKIGYSEFSLTEKSESRIFEYLKNINFFLSKR